MLHPLCVGSSASPKFKHNSTHSLELATYSDKHLEEHRMFLLAHPLLMMEPKLHKHKELMKFSLEIVEDTPTLVAENCAFPLVNFAQTVSTYNHLTLH